MAPGMLRREFLCTLTALVASSRDIGATAFGTRRYYPAWRINGSELTPEEFGAKGDGVTDDSAAIAAWFAAILLTSLPGRLISTYKCNSQIVWDLTSIRTTGIKVTGDGMRNCGLDLTGVTVSPAMKIYSSSGDCFYSTFRDFGILGSLAGIVLQIGDESYTTALNSTTMDPIYVKNYNSGASACAVEINASYNGEFYFVANNAVPYTNNGDALRIGQCAFNVFKGSYSIANNGVNFAAGYSYGNEFSAVDIESVLYGVAVGSDGSSTGTNNFSGGTIVFNLGMVNQTTAHGYNSLIFDGTNYAPNIANAPIIAPGSIATGIVFRGQDITVTPILPASGVPVEVIAHQG